MRRREIYREGAADPPAGEADRTVVARLMSAPGWAVGGPRPHGRDGDGRSPQTGWAAVWQGAGGHVPEHITTTLKAP